MKKTTIALFQFALILFVMVLSAGCSRLVTYSQKGWTVQADPGKQSLAISHKDLGTVLSNIRLNLNKDGKIVELPGWTAKLSNNQILTLSTTSPEATTWQFIVTEEGLDINSSSDNAVITAVAPASGARIPARIRSQDNGIIYTSLGFVTAKNIYCLFDRMTDTLIQFPNKSRLVRSTDNEQLMNVTLPLLPRPGAREGRGRDRRGIKSAPGVEIYLIRDYYTKELGLAHYRPYWPQHPKSHPFETAATGWLSWYCYYMPANEEDMVRETDALAEELGPYGLEYAQLDATYTRGDGYNWLEWNKQFPHGGKWLMQYIKSKGLKPGLWINIYGADYTKHTARTSGR